MKKSILRLTALLLSLGMTVGCGHKAQKADVASITDITEEVSKENSFNGNEKLKMKYAGSERVEYAEPMYNLEADHKFVFENLSEEFMEQDEWECFKVFYDTDFEGNGYVDINIEKDYDNNSITISPNLVFCYDLESGMLDDGTWGSRSKFYLLQYKDIETGETLEKPLVTVFTIKNDMTAPTVTQSVAETGYYKLSWDAVEGADYYEVYYYYDGMDYSELELTTEDTTCDYSQFNTAAERKKHWEETYGDTDMADANHWLMNEHVEPENQYFVVAKSADGKHSGMSNFCAVSDIANQVPSIISDDFQSDYEGDSALALPAYADVTMIDGSVGKFLIEYHGAEVSLWEDGTIAINASLRNLPISMQYMYLRGVDYDKFMEETAQLTAREEELVTKSVTITEDISIPFVPDNNDDSTETEPEVEVTEEPEIETESEAEVTEEPETETESEVEVTEETETETESEVEVTEEPEIETEADTEKENTIFATSALSEWIAINMLNHNEMISLDGFNEASDSEYLMDAVLEAYNQNPLIGVLNCMDYDYTTNTLLVDYYLSEEETTYMQTESLKKASEIADQIITGDMSDYEKEEAINRYLCENASYNEEIMDYINTDGTISEEAVSNFVNSFTPYGILCENLGVCESYSEAFLLIAKAAGLDAIIVTGSMENVNHEWNRVKIDDSWYSLDVTNNDRDILPNSYFNLPDEMAESVLMESGDALLDSSIISYTSEGMDNEYYVKEGRYTEDLTEAVSLLVDGLEEGNISTIRINTETNQQDVEAIVNDAVTEAGLESGMYYYYSGVLSVVKE